MTPRYACHRCKGSGSKLVTGLGVISGARCENCDGRGYEDRKMVVCDACRGEGFTEPGWDFCPECSGTGWAEEKERKIWPEGT